MFADVRMTIILMSGATWMRRCIRTLEGHSDDVYAVCMVRDGVLASGSDDKTVRLWA